MLFKWRWEFRSFAFLCLAVVMFACKRVGFSFNKYWAKDQPQNNRLPTLFLVINCEQTNKENVQVLDEQLLCIFIQSEPWNVFHEKEEWENIGHFIYTVSLHLSPTKCVLPRCWLLLIMRLYSISFTISFLPGYMEPTQ